MQKFPQKFRRSDTVSGGAAETFLNFLELGDLESAKEAKVFECPPCAEHDARQRILC
jgi:hypothetical protein